METAPLLLPTCTQSVDCTILQKLLKMVTAIRIVVSVLFISTYLQVVDEMRGVATVELLYTNPSLRCLLIKLFLPVMEQTAVMMTVRLPLMK